MPFPYPIPPFGMGGVIRRGEDESSGEGPVLDPGRDVDVSDGAERTMLLPGGAGTDTVRDGPYPPAVGTPRSSPSGEPSEYHQLISITPSERRCLSEANLTEHRLETIAMLDYKGLYNAGGELASAGHLFDQRAIERAADLEAVISTFTNLTENQPDELAAAIAQYNSALVATDTDFGLLKILRLLYEYALRSCHYNAFRDEYTFPEVPNFSLYPLDDLDTTGALLRKIANIPNSLPPSYLGGTVELAQTIIALNYATIALTPYEITNRKYRSSGDFTDTSPPTPFLGKFSLSTFGYYPYYIASISRDLLFSSQMVRLRNEEDIDSEYLALIEDRLGSSFINSPTYAGAETTVYQIMNQITGTSFGNGLQVTYPQSSTEDDFRKFSSIVSHTRKHLLGALYYAEGGVSGLKQLFPEASDVTHQNSTTTVTSYTTLAPTVEEAFMGDDVLNFAKFDEHVGNLVSELKFTELFGKTSFGLLEGKDNFPGQTSQIGRAANATPGSMSSITAQMVDLLNRKFFAPFSSVAYSEFTEWFTPEHISYNKLIAYILIRDEPGLAIRIIQGFLDDVDAGWLTADSLPEVIDLEEMDALIGSTEDVEAGVESILHVLPGTNTAVDLTGKTPALRTAIWHLYWHYRNRGAEAEIQPNTAGEARTMFPPIGAIGKTTWETDTGTIFCTLPPGNVSSLDAPIGETTDCRALNVMAMYYGKAREMKSHGETGVYYLGVKIVACEIIDAFLSLMRDIMEPWAPVVPVADTDPVFPALTVPHSPYAGGAKWDLNEPGYEAFQMSTWVPTVLAWRATFARTSSHNTYFRGKSLRSQAHMMMYALSHMLEKTDRVVETVVTQFTQPEYDEYGSYVSGAVQAGFSDDFWYFPIAVSLKGCGTHLVNGDYYKAFFDATTYRLDELLGTDEAIDGDTTFLPDSSGDDFFDSYNMTGYNWQASGNSNTVINRLKEFVEIAQFEDNTLGFLYDYLGKYGDRILNYQNAVTDLIESESTPLGELISNLEELGDGGIDILQNLTPSQFALKQVALEEEKADTNNAYLPMLSIIDPAEQRAVRHLSSSPTALVPESSTTKVIFVGVPTGTFDTFKNQLNEPARLEIVDTSNSIDTAVDEEQRFNVRVTYIDVEYPQIVFRPKSYAFRNDIYVLPEAMRDPSTTWYSIDNFEDVYKYTTFSQLNMRVKESPDSSADITIEDEIVNYSYPDVPEYDDVNADSLVNLLASETLKIYYRMMLGVNFSETVFPTSPDSMNIPIGDYASSLAESMADTVSELSTSLPDLSKNIEEILGDLSTLSDPESFVSGELTAVDAALLETLRDAYQTRLFSADELRSRVLSAKMFDRILAIPVDPDEFYVVAPGEADTMMTRQGIEAGIETQQKIFDYYLDAGIIIETGDPSPKNYKLAPRTTAEGTMAFGKITVSLEPYSEGKDRIFDL